MELRFPAYHTEKYSPQSSKPAELHVAVQIALKALSWPISEEDHNRIIVALKMNVWSWGETILISFLPDNSISVTSRCAFPLQCIDWGKNKVNVERFMEEFRKHVPAATRREASAPSKDDRIRSQHPGAKRTTAHIVANSTQAGSHIARPKAKMGSDSQSARKAWKAEKNLDKAKEHFEKYRQAKENDANEAVGFGGLPTELANGVGAQDAVPEIRVARVEDKPVQAPSESSSADAGGWDFDC